MIHFNNWELIRGRAYWVPKGTHEAIRRIAESQEYLRLVDMVAPLVEKDGSLAIKSATKDHLAGIKGQFLLLRDMIGRELCYLSCHRERLDFWRRIRCQMPIILQLLKL